MMMITNRRTDWQRRLAAMGAILATGMAVCLAQQKGNPATGAGTAASASAAQQFAMAQQTAATAAAASTPAQRQAASNGSFSAASSSDDPLFSLGDSVRARRNDERQKRLENDTQRLLNLANQLKSEVAASGAQSMTPEMLRQMDEIEKLARSVKDRMRS